MKIVVIEPLGVEEALLREIAEQKLGPGHEIIIHSSRTADAGELIARGQDADIIALANLPFPAEVIQGCGKLQMLSVAFTGVDHIALPACRERGIPPPPWQTWFLACSSPSIAAFPPAIP